MGTPRCDSFYALAVLQASDVLASIEDELKKLPDGTTLDTNQLRNLPGSGAVSDELGSLLLNALEETGVALRVGQVLRLSSSGLQRSEQFRWGVRTGIASIPRQTDPRMRLVCSFPGQLGEDLEAILRKEATDLRVALIDLIASSQENLILASPYWDEETVTDLGDKIRGRLDAGVHVDVLGRTANPRTERGRPLSALQARFAAYDHFRIRTWYEVDEEDPWGGRTFHFKAAVADDGARAYLGTANFTTGGLRSRFEIGIMLGGDHARGLARILKVALELGT